jgi:membrane protein YqaA with SNARE-associated domain
LLHQLTAVLVAWGPLGILLLSILDSSGVPVAGVFDALLILLAVERPGVAWICAAMAVIGSTVGCLILFQAAHHGGRRFMEKMAPDGKAAKFRQWFRRYGLLTVFVPALMPIPMPLKLFIVSAGVMGTELRAFVPVIVLARVLRYFGEAWLGVMLGKDSTHFLATHVWQFVAGAMGLFGVLYLIASLRARHSEHALPPANGTT